MIENTPPGTESVAVAPWQLLATGLVIGALVLVASRVVSFYDPDSLADDDRGQMDAGGHGRLVVGLLIALTVLVIVLDELFTVVGSELRGERITELGGPWMTPAEGVGVLVLGVVVLGSVHLLSWLDDRDSANGDRSVIDDDRGQLDAGLPLWWRLLPGALAVLVLVASEVIGRL